MRSGESYSHPRNLLPIHGTVVFGYQRIETPLVICVIETSKFTLLRRKWRYDHGFGVMLAAKSVGHGLTSQASVRQVTP